MVLVIHNRIYRTQANLVPNESVVVVTAIDPAMTSLASGAAIDLNVP